MANKDKKSGMLEGFEGPAGFFIREFIKAQLPKAMDWLKLTYPDVFFTLAWAFNDASPDAAKLKDKIMTGLVFTGWIGERVTDTFGAQSTAAKVIELAMGDFPSAVKDYFEREKPTRPDTFKPVGPDKFDEFIKDMQDRMQRFYARFFTDAKEFILHLVDMIKHFKLPHFENPFKSSLSKFMAVMFQNQDKEVEAGFNTFFKKELKGKPERIRVFLSFIEQWDTQDEWDGFFKKIPTSQHDEFEAACQLHEQTTVPRVSRETKAAVQKVGRFAVVGLEAANTRLEARQARRKEEDALLLRRMIKAAVLIVGLLLLSNGLAPALAPGRPWAQWLVTIFVSGVVAGLYWYYRRLRSQSDDSTAPPARRSTKFSAWLILSLLLTVSTLVGGIVLHVRHEPKANYLFLGALSFACTSIYVFSSTGDTTNG